MGFYCENHVSKGRKFKTCCMCGKTINKGDSSYSIPGENFEVNYDMCTPCHNSCDKAGIDDISEVQMYNEDDGDEE